MCESSCYIKEGKIFFIASRIPSKKAVLRKLGVKKHTFAGNMVSRVYDYYFDGAVNFRKEYKKYYRKEFGAVVTYIEERYNVEPSEAEILYKKNFSVKDFLHQSIERNIETLNYDVDFKNAFSDCVGGIEYEDQDGIYY